MKYIAGKCKECKYFGNLNLFASKDIGQICNTANEAALENHKSICQRPSNVLPMSRTRYRLKVLVMWYVSLQSARLDED